MKDERSAGHRHLREEGAQGGDAVRSAAARPAASMDNAKNAHVAGTTCGAFANDPVIRIAKIPAGPQPILALQSEAADPGVEGFAAPLLAARAPLTEVFAIALGA